MIKQAYILSTLGKAFIKQNEDWWVMDAHRATGIRRLQPADHNAWTLGQSELSYLENIVDELTLRQELERQTRQQEALTLALQLMDTDITNESIKHRIADLLGEYTQEPSVLGFVTNRLYASLVPASFDPAAVASYCLARNQQVLAELYVGLEGLKSIIPQFLTAWKKEQTHFFADPVQAERAFDLLVAAGLVKGFLQAIYKADLKNWDNTFVAARLLWQKNGIQAQRGFFDAIKSTLSTAHGLQLVSGQEYVLAVESTEETDSDRNIQSLLDKYIDAYYQDEQTKHSRKGAKKNLEKLARRQDTRDRASHKFTYVNPDSIQKNVTYQLNEIEAWLSKGEPDQARDAVYRLLQWQLPLSEPKHICRTLCSVASVALESSNYDFAQEMVDYARYMDATDVVVDNLTAEILKSKGDLAGARRVYESVVNQYPNNIFAQNGYAEVLKAQGDLSGAKRIYESVMEQYPDNVIAQSGYAEVLKAQGDLGAAKRIYEAIMGQYPDSVVTQTGYAKVLKAQGDWSAAKRIYESIMKRYPDNLVVQTGYAEVLKAQGDLSGAKRVYESIMKEYSNNVVTQNGYAGVLKAQGDLPGAKRIYESVMRQYPDDVFAQNGYADVLKAQGDLTGARLVYESVMKQYPDDVVAQNSYAEVLKTQGDLKAAKRIYESVMKQYPDDRVAQTGYAEVLKAQGDLSGAKRIYESVMEQHPENVIVRSGYAEVLKTQGDLTGARLVYESVMEQHPENVIVRSGYAEVLKTQGDLTGARLVYESVMEQHPENVFGQAGYAEVLKAQGDLLGAKRVYESVINRYPDNVVAQSGYAEVLKAEGDIEGARAMYESILSKRPNDPYSLHALASIKLLLNEAVDEIERVLEPQSVQDYFWQYLYMLKLIKLNQTQEALVLVEETAQKCPFYQNKVFFKRLRRYIALRQHDAELLKKELLEEKLDPNNQIDGLLRVHALAVTDQLAEAQIELKAHDSFQKIRVLHKTARLISDRYNLGAVSPSGIGSSVSEEDIFEGEYEALLLMAA